LDWCLNSCTLSLPRCKIDKALLRVEALLASPTVTKSQLQKLVGSLRHVCTCIPAARPFYQRLQSACRIPRGCKHKITEDLKADAEWIEANHEEISGGNSAVANLIDNVTGIYLTTIYKLENLK
jgi:hypothetical protein